MSSVARLSGGILTLAVVAALACGHNQNSSEISTGLVGPSGPIKSDLILICHREDQSTAYGPLQVLPSAVAGHLAHGDGLVGDLVPGRNDVKFGSDCSFTQLFAVQIGFGALKTDGAPFSTLEESGFTVVARSGAWEAMSTYGFPEPAVIIRRDAVAPDVEGELAVTLGGQLFVFNDVALYSSMTKIPYWIRGYRGGVEVISMSDVVPNTFGRFVKVTNTSPPAMLDTLVLRIVNPAGGCCSNPSGLDTINLKR